jgi:excisionase family DNA binding protein
MPATAPADVSADETIYSPQEVAEATGKGIATVYRHLRNGKLPAEKFGGEWIITDEGLREWLPAALYRRFFGQGEEA